MIIENFKVERFGGHELIDFNSDSSLVGIFGINGSGKSTLLEALKFAITGETAKSQDSYVMDLQGSGSVTVRFRKNGKVGTIHRNIGTKMTRSLEWDGRKITAAKEVAATMAEIFGADKKAVANAVFIAQGAIQGMLFTGDAAKRDAFVELLNLSFCAGRAEVLNRKIQKLQSTIVDLTPARDAALSQRDTAAQVYLDKKTVFEGSYAWTAEVDYMLATQKANNELQIFRTQYDQAGVDHQIKSSELDGLLSKYKWESMQDCQVALTQSTSYLAELERQLGDKQRVRAQLDHYDRVGRDISSIYKEMSTIQQRVFQSDPNKVGLLEWMRRRHSLDADEKTQARRKFLLEDLKRVRAEAKLQEKQPLAPHWDEAGLAEQLKQVQQAESDTVWHCKNLVMQRDIASCFEGVEIAGEMRCPKCALTITDAARLSPDELSRMEARGYELETEAQRGRADYTKKKTIWDRYVRESDLLREMKVKTNKRIAEIETELLGLTEVDAGLIVFEKEKVDGVISVLRSAVGEEESARKRLSAKLAERNGYTLAAQYLSTRTDYCDEIVTECVCRKDAEKQLVAKMTQEMQEMTVVLRETVRLVALKDKLNKEIEARERVAAQVRSEPLQVLALEITDADLLQREVSARHTLWVELRAQVQQLETTYAAANAAFYEIEDRMKRDEQKRLLIADLLKLKDLLSNDGLPLAYSRLQFEKLAELTQINLAKLNATFAIEIDRSRDLAFSFKRLDKDGGVLLPMSSLSGGQRVRLCVAFLIAVQKHLVPDVGLLVLDEPSTSVDAVGREDIAEFLSGLGRELGNVEMQLWVCDHSMEIKDRVDCKIEL